MRWMNLVADGGLSWRSACCFDPGTLTMGAMAATAAGGAMSASSTLAGGNAAQQAGQLMAQQDRMNAAQAFASGQRKALDTTQNTNLAISTNTARAAASGVNAGVGSPATNAGDIAKRGSYQALMDMFNGESEKTGLLNKANEEEWEGNVKQQQSRLAALGTLAGTAGSMFQQYGMYKYPNLYGRAGAGMA